MKKNRPTYLLTVTSNTKDMEKLQEIIFRETTTIGIRYRHENRTKLDREPVKIDTPYGSVDGKRVVYKDQEYIYPEYESVKKTAEASGVPLKEVFRISQNPRETENQRME